MTPLKRFKTAKSPHVHKFKEGYPNRPLLFVASILQVKNRSKLR